MAALKTKLILGLFSSGLLAVSCSQAPPVATAYKESGDFQAAEAGDGNNGGQGGGNESGGGDNAAAVQFATEFFDSNNCTVCHPSMIDLGPLGPYDATTIAAGADIDDHASFAEEWPTADSEESQALADIVNEEFPAD